MLPPLHVLEKHVTPAGGEASHTFANIDTLVAAWDAIAGVTSRHLVVISNAASPDAVDARNLNIRLNGDAGANYHQEVIFGAAAATGAVINTGITSLGGVTIPGTNFGAGAAFGGGLQIIIPHAFGAVNHKAALGLGGAVEVQLDARAYRWANIAPITSLSLDPIGNLAAGSILLLCVVDERFNIGEQLLGAPGVFDFNNLSLRDGNISVVGYLRSDEAAQDLDELLHEINGDAVAANYAQQELRGNGGALGAAQANDREVGVLPAAGATANAFGAFLVTYSAFARGENDPHFLSLSGFHESTGPTAEVRSMSGRRNNVEAITRLEYEPNGGASFATGSMMSLYFTPINRELLRRRIFNVDKTEAEWDDLDQFVSDNFDALTSQFYARSDRVNINDGIDVLFNDDAVAANYDRQYLNGAGAVVSAARDAAQPQAIVIPGATEGVNEFGGGAMMLPAWDLNDRHKHGIVLAGRQENFVWLASHRWEDTSPIVKITATPTNGPNLVTGTVAELWGLVPLDQVIRRRQDRLAAGRDATIQPQNLRPGGRAWRH